MHSFTQLVEQFEQRLSQSLPFPELPGTLYDPCRYFLQIGGKRVRPVLCLMANELFGEINEDAWHGAIGIELFHNFTLIHDDIMDKAPLRRGKTTVHEKYGLTAGILCGDVMSIYAYDQLAHIEQNLSLILHLFNKTSIEVCEGQQLDMDFESRNDVSIDEYIHMITLKTSVLLACSLKMGALLGGTTEGNANKLYTFGKNLGIAFQLQDDYLDAFGDPETFGKQVGGDIIENKKTFLYLTALARSERKEALQLEHLYSISPRDASGKIEAVKALFESSGAAELTKEEISKYTKMAFEVLEKLEIPQEKKELLRKYGRSLMEREV